MSPLEEKIRNAINAVSAENGSNTPDFILARYLVTCLDAFDVAMQERAIWYGRMDVPGRGSIPIAEYRAEKE